MAERADTALAGVTEDLMQTQNQSGQDPIRFPPKLDNQLVELYNFITGVDGYISGGPEGRPSQGAYERFDDLNIEWGGVRGRLQSVIVNELQELNDLLERLGLPTVNVPNERIIS